MKPPPSPARLEWLGLSLAVALAVALLALSAALTGTGEHPLTGPPQAHASDGCPYGRPDPTALPIRFISV